MVRILREMLVWQARDKEFLAKSFKTASEKSKHTPNSHQKINKNFLTFPPFFFSIDLLRRRRLAEIAACEASNISSRASGQVHEPSTSQDE